MKNFSRTAVLAIMIIGFVVSVGGVGAKALAHFNPNSYNNSKKVYMQKNTGGEICRSVQYEQDFMQAINDLRQKQKLEPIVTSDLLEKSVEMIFNPTEEMRGKSMGEKREMCPHPCFDIYTMRFEKDIYGDWSAEKLFKTIYEENRMLGANFDSDNPGKDMAFRIYENDDNFCILMLSTSDRYIEMKENAQHNTKKEIEARLGIELP